MPSTLAKMRLSLRGPNHSRQEIKSVPAMFILYFLLTALIPSQLSFSAPVPSSEEYLSWKSVPNTRGTWNILSSCLITLSLCVYTAVHLNIPGPDTSTLHRGLRRAKWTLMGILAPELVVYTAWRQWSSAKQLTREIRKLAEKWDAPNQQLLLGWSMTHSFFAEMGGFMIDCQRQEGPAYTTEKRITLTARGILELVRMGYNLPLLSETTVKDKSKADSLAKTLALLQAAYMILEQIGRLAFHLPITMLEVNTLGHVFCALTMYVFWLKKPLNIDEPVAVTGDWVKSYSAVGVMQYQKLFKDGPGPAFRKQHPLPEFYIFEDIARRLKQNVLVIAHSASLGGTRLPTRDIENGSVGAARFSTESVVLWIQDPALNMTAEDARTQIQDYEFWSQVCTSTCQIERELRPRYTSLGDGKREIHLSWEALERWELVWKIFSQDNDIFNTAFRYGVSTQRCQNWAETGTQLTADRESLAVLAIAFATAVYGGLHAILWNSHFPTITEQWLWRSSASVIAGSGLVATPLIIWEDDIDEFLENFHYHVIRSLLCSIALCYIFCRLYLVIEAFISLRSLPADAYLTPQWTQWFPHL